VVRDFTSPYPDRITNALGHSTDFIYDVGTGNILNQTKNGIKTTFRYDAFERIRKEILPYDTAVFSTKSYTYTFDGVVPEVIKVSQKTTSNNTLDTYYFYDGFILFQPSP